MWEKIKNFFSNKIVKIVEIVIMVICAVGLIIGGIKTTDLQQVIDFVGAGIIAITALVEFIKTILNKSEA